MPIDLTCSCGKHLRVADAFAGRQGQCPVCGRLLEIPERDAPDGGAGPSPPEAEQQAVTATPEWTGPVELDSPEGAATGLPPEPAERMPEEAEIVRPGYKLFSPGSIGLVAFLAGPVGAIFLLTLNYWRLGERRAAWMTIACGLVGMVVVAVVSIALPENFPGLLIGLPLFLVLWGAAKALQGSAYDAHRQKGGEGASGWTAAGFGLLGIVVYLGVFFGLFAAYDFYVNESYGQKIDFGGGEEIYYTREATEADARALGAYLRESGSFDGRGPKTVRVSRDGDRLVIAFIVQEWVLRDPQAQQDFRTLGQQASQRAFGGRPVVVELCDEHFNVKKKM